jgi:hypothetical protein
MNAMPRLPLLAPTVLMSLGLLPGACFAQQGFPYGTVAPARSFAQNAPTAAFGSGNQAALPRGPKTITFSSATVAMLPPGPVGVGAGAGTQPTGTVGNSPTNGSAQAGGPMTPGDPLTGQQSAPTVSAEQPSRVTNPMLQNMSNPSNLSHTGIASGQQMAPNLSFGRQFKDWSNLRDPGSMPESFGGLSRTQPQAFGGYVAPNTYAGSGFSNWSNLSSGVVTPNPLGGWSFSVR